MHTARNTQHTLYVIFGEYPAIPLQDHAHDYMQARTCVQEAGYEFQPYGLTDIISRHWQEDTQFMGKITKSEQMHVDPATLVGAALTLDHDGLFELLAQGFEAYAQAKADYEREIQEHRQKAGKRRNV